MTTETEFMKTILQRQPQLGAFGFGVFDEYKKTKEQRAAELQRHRDEMLTSNSLKQFTSARDWLRRFDKIKRVNQSGTSYGLKHIAEKDIGYTPNGVFIAAAIAEGFIVKRDEDSPNALLNISTKAWR